MMIKLNLYSLHQIEHIFQIHLPPPLILEILTFPFAPRQKILVLHFPATCLWRSMSLMFAGLLTWKFEESVTFATTSLQMPQKPLSVPLFCQNLTTSLQIPQKLLSVLLFCQNLTTVILCYQAVQINFLSNCKRSKFCSKTCLQTSKARTY